MNRVGCNEVARFHFSKEWVGLIKSSFYRALEIRSWSN
jgi:hypothetical protein